MSPHDYDSLNDAQCLHADLFKERLSHWRCQPLADELCFRFARRDAQGRFILEGGEVAQMDDYIATRFGVPKAAREPAGLPVPMMVVG